MGLKRPALKIAPSTQQKQSIEENFYSFSPLTNEYGIEGESI